MTDSLLEDLPVSELPKCEHVESAAMTSTSPLTKIPAAGASKMNQRSASHAKQSIEESQETDLDLHANRPVESTQSSSSCSENAPNKNGHEPHGRRSQTNLRGVRIQRLEHRLIKVETQVQIVLVLQLAIAGGIVSLL